MMERVNTVANAQPPLTQQDDEFSARTPRPLLRPSLGSSAPPPTLPLFLSLIRGWWDYRVMSSAIEEAKVQISEPQLSFYDFQNSTLPKLRKTPDNLDSHSRGLSGTDGRTFFFPREEIEITLSANGAETVIKLLIFLILLGSPEQPSQTDCSMKGEKFLLLFVLLVIG